MFRGPDRPVLLEGGRVFTGNRHRPWTDAVAFDGSGVLSVGSTDNVRDAVPSAERADVHGRTVVPGFIDAHNHFLATGESLESVDVRFPAVSSVDDLVEAVRRAADATPPGAPIRAFGFDHAKYERGPTRWDLDRATRRHPVLVYHVSGHHVLVNSTTLEQRGVPDDTSDPPGGEVVRDENGRLTGLFLDAAMGLVLPVAVDIGSHGPNFHTLAPIGELVDDIERAGRAFLAAGLTTVCDAQVTRRELSAYAAARAAGRLLVRTVAMPLSHQLEEYHSIGLAGPFGDDVLSIGAMKFYADGSLIGGTAAFAEPYGAAGEFEGSLYWEPNDLGRMIARAHEDGWQIGAHVQGDRAIQMVLDAIETSTTTFPRDHRHRLEHAGYPTPSQIARMAAMGVITVNQPRYLYDSGDEFIDRLGERAQRLIPLREELDAGVVVVLSSDSDVASYRPMDTIEAAIERRTHRGEAIGEAQRLTLEEALFAHTADAAYALFRDDRLGTLEVGKRADVVVLDADLPSVATDELHDVQVRTTYLDGRAVYEAAAS